MALQGPFAVIADHAARDIVEALRTSGAYPIVEARWADAPAALQARPPQAVILAEPCPDRARASALAKALSAQAEHDADLFVPVIARTRDDAALSLRSLPPCLADALTITAKAPAERLVRRLSCGAAGAHPARHGAAAHAHVRHARPETAGAARRRSARRSARIGRRPRPLLSGPVHGHRRARRRHWRAHGRRRGVARSSRAMLTP